jgi:hypothetical protein
MAKYSKNLNYISMLAKLSEIYTLMTKTNWWMSISGVSLEYLWSISGRTYFQYVEIASF